MENWLIALAIITATACTSAKTTSPDAALVGLDPTGNWNVVYAFAPGCGNPATTTSGTFAVTFSAKGYDVEVAGVVSTGALVCSTSACRLSGTWAWRTTDANYQQSMNLMLDTANMVTGNGTEAVITATSNCTYSFTVTGSRM